MVHPSSFLDPAFGDPKRYRHQKGRRPLLCPDDRSTVLQTITPIGVTDTKISVTEQIERDRERKNYSRLIRRNIIGPTSVCVCRITNTSNLHSHKAKPIPTPIII